MHPPPGENAKSLSTRLRAETMKLGRRIGPRGDRAMKSLAWALISCLLFWCGTLGAVAGADESVRSVRRIPADCRSRLYTSNREPLLPSPLVKLPIGRITPKGWLRNMLEIEAQGLTGRLAEVSPWLKWESNAWSDREGRGQYGWEEAALLAEGLRRFGLRAERPRDHRQGPPLDRGRLGRSGARMAGSVLASWRSRSRASPTCGRT